MSRIRSSLCVKVPSCQPESVCEDLEEDPTPTDYRDALLRTIQPTVIPEFTADLDDEIIWPSLPSVSVPRVSRTSVPKVRTSVSRRSALVPSVPSAPTPSVRASVSRRSAPVPRVPSVSPRSAPVPSVRASVSSVSAPVPSVPSVSPRSAPVPCVRANVQCKCSYPQCA